MKIELIFGDVLRELRKKCKISQEKLAQECDLDRTFISLLERGQWHHHSLQYSSCPLYWAFPLLNSVNC